jgi:hypothetical protein
MFREKLPYPCLDPPLVPRAWVFEVPCRGGTFRASEFLGQTHFNLVFGA